MKQQFLRTVKAPAFLIFLGTLVLYAYFYGGADDHIRAHMSLTRALTHQQTVIVDPYVNLTHDLAFHDGHYYVAKPPGFAFTATPFWTVGDRLFGDLDAVWRTTTIILAAIPGAATAVVFYFLLLGFGLQKRTAVICTLPVTFGTGLFSYSTLFLEVPLVSLSLLAACWLVLTQKANFKTAAMAGFLMGYASLLQYLVVFCAIPIGVHFLAKTKRFKLIIVYCLAFSIPLTLILVYNYWCFANPFQFGHFTSAVPQFQQQHDQILSSIFIPRAEAVHGLLISLNKGLFVFSPFLFLSLLGFIPLVKEAKYRAAAITFLSMFVLSFFFISSLPNWPGGVLSGPRYLLPVEPILALGIAGLMKLKNRGLKTSVMLTLALTSLVSIAVWFLLSVLAPFSSEWLANPIVEQHIPDLLKGNLRPNLAIMAGIPGFFSLIPGVVTSAFLFFLAWKLALPSHQSSTLEG